MISKISVRIKIIAFGVASILAVIALVASSIRLIYYRIGDFQSADASANAGQNVDRKLLSSTTGEIISEANNSAVKTSNVQVMPEASKPVAMLNNVETRIEELNRKEALTFDMARIEPNGHAVFAGRAIPGSVVMLYSETEKLWESKSDEKGNWVIVLDDTLPEGITNIHLVAHDANGLQIMSKQVLAVAIDKKNAHMPFVLIWDREKDDPAKLQLSSKIHKQEIAGHVSGSASDDSDNKEEFVVSVAWGHNIEDGRLILSGRSRADTIARIKYDGVLIGDVAVDKRGNWTLKSHYMPDNARHVVNVTYLQTRGGMFLANTESFFIAKKLKNDEYILIEADVPIKADENGIWKCVVPEKNNTVVNCSASGHIIIDQIVINSGDSLWNVAEIIYGNGIYYDRIYRANRDVIGNPDLIYPGQTLLTPNSNTRGKFVNGSHRF